MNGLRGIGLCLLAVALLGAAGAWAQTGVEVSEGAADVTVITSDKLTFDYKKRYAVFENNVEVSDPQMRLTSDKLAIWFNEGGEVTLIKAEGNVHIVQDDKMAIAGEAVYEVVEGKITLTRNPRLQRGRHYLEGTTITYWRDQELLVCEPQSKLVIYPDGDTSRPQIFGD